MVNDVGTTLLHECVLRLVCLNVERRAGDLAEVFGLRARACVCVAVFACVCVRAPRK